MNTKMLDENLIMRRCYIQIGPDNARFDERRVYMRRCV